MLKSTPIFEFPQTHIGVITSSSTSSIGSSTTLAIDAAGERSAWVFRVPKSGTIKKVRFSTGAVSSSQDLSCTLQTTSATDGYPTGTGYGSSSTETVATPAANTIYTVTFATGATATAGDIIAFVIEWAGTAGNVQFARWVFTGLIAQSIPYNAQYTSSWAKVTINAPLTVMYDDDTTEVIGVPPSSITTCTIAPTSATTPDEVGLRFKMPFGARAVGVKGYYHTVSGRDCKLVLYNDAGTELVSVTPDNDQTGGNSLLQIFRFTSTVTLQKDAWYRLCYQPATTNANIIPHFIFTDSNELGQMAGANVYHCERTNAGSFTDATNKYTVIGLLVDAVDIPGGVFMVNE